MILGHCNQTINERMSNALESVVSVNDTKLTGEGVKKINECFPSIEMMRFSLSGTEAIQNVFRLARAYTGKQKIVRFLGHFHGRRKGKLLSNMVIVKIKCYEEEGFK